MDPAADRASPDALLWQRVRRGDEAAFVGLYRAHAGPLLRFVLRLTGSPAAAEDVLQDVFLALIDGTGAGFDPARGTLRAFLFGMARNLGLRRVRQGPFPAPPADRIGRRADDDEQAVRTALLRLEPVYREVVLLCDLEGLQYEEAAAALDVPVGTVRSRLSRARGQLADLLGDGDPAAAAVEKEAR